MDVLKTRLDIGVRSLAACAAACIGLAAHAQDENCQLPDQAGHGAGGTVAATSDEASGFAVSDNFAIDGGGVIDTVTWWGTYTDFVDPCADGDVADDFTITYFDNNPGCPGGSPNAIIAGPFSVKPDKVATGNVIPSGLGDLVEYEYTASHADVSVNAGACTWIQITNNTAGGVCLWLWETAEGDGASWQAGAPDPANDFDLALCLNLDLGDTSTCALPFEPLCEGGEGSCGEANGTPGCDDPCCCSLVCGQDPGCCVLEWDQICADIALGFGCATLPPCQPEANCQVFRTENAYNSDGTNFLAAEDFSPAEDGVVSNICWYGVYNVGTPDDAFTVRYYDDASGAPGDVIADFSQGGGTLDLELREDTGELVAGFPLFAYTANHADVEVSADGCYWIEISNPNDGSSAWFWSLAAKSNGRAMQSAGGAYGIDAFLPQDLAVCLGLELGAPCGIEDVFDTGPRRTVNWDAGGGCNFAPTFLGWSSGNLGAAQPQRWSAQAFNVPAPPEGDAWHITSIEINGFLVDGFPVDTFNYIVWNRTGFDVPVDGDQVTQGSAPIDAGFDDPDIPDGDDDLFGAQTSFDLAPGNYWLSFFASNAGGTLSNLAWFTNAEFGINNLDKVDKPFHWRAEMFPDPGFVFYQLSDCQLAEIDTDPHDLYNAAFRLRGSAGAEDPVDCDGDVDGDGTVNGTDLILLLGSWGTDNAAADFDGSGTVDGTDLIILLGAWGDCP